MYKKSALLVIFLLISVVSGISVFNLPMLLTVSLHPIDAATAQRDSRNDDDGNNEGAGNNGGGNNEMRG